MLFVLVAAIVLASVRRDPEQLIALIVFFLMAVLVARGMIFSRVDRILFGNGTPGRLPGEGSSPEVARRFDENIQAADELIERERFAEALEALGRAAAIDPSDLRVILSQKVCYTRLERLPEAVDLLERATEAHPESALLRYSLACCLSQNGEPQPALTALTLALELAPDLRTQAAADPDLEPLRGTSEFLHVIRGAGQAL